MITYTEVSGVDVARVLDKVSKAVYGEEETAIQMAMIAGAIALQKPDVDGEQLRTLIKSTSEYIAMQLEEVGGTVHGNN